jgi:hypothetical protein
VPDPIPPWQSYFITYPINFHPYRNASPIISLPNIKIRTVSAQFLVRPDRWDPPVSGSTERRRWRCEQYKGRRLKIPTPHAPGRGRLPEEKEGRERPASALPPDPAPRRRPPWPCLHLDSSAGDSYTSCLRRSPSWSSSPVEKAGAEVEPPAARSHKQSPPPAMRAPAPAAMMASAPGAMRPRGRALTMPPPDQHRMNGEE